MSPDIHKTDFIKRQNGLRQQIINGENERLELKSSLRWDLKEKRTNPELEFVIAKSISGFMNSDGGQIIIGVEDNRNVLGLDLDYGTLSKQNRDGFLLCLNGVVIKYFSKDNFSFILPRIELLDEKEICVIDVRKSTKPNFLSREGKDLFFIRSTNSYQLLGIQEGVSYIRDHWK
jgi:predicted HTH transcriptional regulator